MKFDRTLTLSNDELEKLAVILIAIPPEIWQRLPVEIRKFYRELFEYTTQRKFDDEPGAGQTFLPGDLRPPQKGPYPTRPANFNQQQEKR